MNEIRYRGMLMRDWFAGQALAGLLAYPRAESDVTDKFVEHLTKRAYEYADAMLAQRNKNDS